MVQVFKKAANRPIGYIASAVMLNAKLKPGLSLLHVIALTKSLGEIQAPLDMNEKKTVLREVFVWRDGSDSSVRCTFDNGRLIAFELERPVQED